MKKLLIAPILLVIAIAVSAATIEVPEAPAFMLIAGGGVAGGGTDTVGNTDIGAEGTYPPTAGRLYCYAKFQPPHSGNVTSIELYGASSSAELDIEVGIYQDSSGSPSSKIGTETEFSDIGTFSAQWKEFSGLSYAVNSANTYWICANFSAQQFTMNYDAGSGTERTYNALSYGTEWPASYTVTSSDSNVYSAKASVDY